MPFEARLASLPEMGSTNNRQVNSFVEFALDTLRKRVKPIVPPEEWDKLMSDLEFGRSNYLEGSATYPIGPTTPW